MEKIPKKLHDFLYNDVCIFKHEYISSTPNIINNIFKKVFVITLAGEHIRQAIIRAAMKHLNISYTMCIMSPPSSFLYDEYTNWINIRRSRGEIIQNLSKGELGCAASHHYLLNYISNFPEQVDTQSSFIKAEFLILEDDVCFHKNFSELLQRFINVDEIKKSEVILLGASDWNLNKRIISDNPYYYPYPLNYKIYSTYSYAISKNKSNHLKTLIDKLEKPCDNYWNTIFDENKNNLVILWPYLIIPERSTSSINHIKLPGTNEEIEYLNKCGANIVDWSAYNKLCIAAFEQPHLENSIKNFENYLNNIEFENNSNIIVKRFTDNLREISWEREHLVQLYNEILPQKLQTSALNLEKQDMAICLAFFSPVGYQNPKKNLLKCIMSLHPYPVYLMELCYNENKPIFSDIRGISHFHVKSDSVMFHKENLYNLLEKHVDTKYSKLLFLDADILFTEPCWYSTISSLLDINNVVQPFQVVSHMIPNSTEISYRIQSGVMAVCHKNENNNYIFKNPYPSPGFGIACRRDWFLKMGGFIDFAMMGGGDLLFYSIVCDINIQHRLAYIHQPYVQALYHSYLKKYKLRMTDKNMSSCAYAPLHIKHLFHGWIDNRQYNTRHNNTKNLKVEDFKRNTYGVLEFVDKEKWNPVIVEYFQNRKEDDENVITEYL